MGIGQNIKNYRKLAGFSQKELGAKLGVSDKTICSWEVDRTEPSIDMVDKLCNILEVTRTELSTGYKFSPEYKLGFAMAQMTLDETKLKLVQIISEMSEDNTKILLKYAEFLNTKKEGD